MRNWRAESLRCRPTQKLYNIILLAYILPTTYLSAGGYDLSGIKVEKLKLHTHLERVSRMAVSNSSADGLTIVSWNINGIRSLASPLKSILDSFDSDIICLQEIKATRDLMDETVANVHGYNSYFSFSRRRSGYSGVATYCRHRVTPIAAEEGLTGCGVNLKDEVGCHDNGDFGPELLHAVDSEGRAVLTKHSIRLQDGDEKQFTVINVYCPRADPEKRERVEFKLQFYEILLLRSKAILNSGCHVLIVGDINTSHRPIDHCDPGNIEVSCTMFTYASMRFLTLGKSNS